MKSQLTCRLCLVVTVALCSLLSAPSLAKDSQRRCDRGDARSCLSVAVGMLNATGSPEDIMMGMGLAERSCELSLADGCYLLALHYAAGDLIARNYGVAIRFSGRGCVLGSVDACQLIRELYRDDHGTTADYADASAQMAAACDDGKTMACGGVEQQVKKRGYNGTRWGMSPLEVAAIHPSGATKITDGSVEYTLIGSVAEHSPVVTTYGFTDGELRSVFLAFPTPGGKIGADFSFTPMSSATACAVYESVLRDLIMVYGQTSVSTTVLSQWLPEDVDYYVTLSKMSVSTDGFMVGVLYKPTGLTNRSKL